MKRSLVLIIPILLIAVFSVGFIASFRNFNQTKENSLSKSPSPNPAVLSAAASPSPSTVPTPVKTIEVAASAKPTPTQIKLSKQTYVIAAFGDSMIETMGENLDYLGKSLKKRYPDTAFKLYNYGIGSQNIVEGLARFHTPFQYKTRNYPPIDQINADIIIIGSFAYNPLSPYDRNRHYSALTSLIQEAKSTHAKVYLLAEIAPVQNNFGRGPGGIDWTDEMIKTHVTHIFEQLDNAVNLANSTKTPLVNAYAKSQTNGKYGNPVYVSTHDHIHPSIEGEVFMAELIASKITFP